MTEITFQYVNFAKFAILMFKQLAAFILLVAFAMQVFNRNVIIADYYTNTITYAKNCVNKANPKMRCNGKCQMIKKLQHEEKKDQQNPERNNFKDEVASIKTFFTKIAPVETTIVATHYSYNDNTIVNRSKDFFHPPC